MSDAAHFKAMQDSAAKQEAFYLQHYEPLLVARLDCDRKTFLGDRGSRICRFCGEKRPTVTFKKDAHVIPAFLGNRFLLSYYECDTCNDYFGRNADDDFAKYCGLQGVGAAVRGRTGTRKFHSADNRLRWKVQGTDSEIEATTDMVKIDEASGKMTISAPVQTYVPRNAFRSLLKMALTVMPERHVAAFPKPFAWLRKANNESAEEKKHQLIAYLTTVGGSRAQLNHITVALSVRRHAKAQVPHCTFAIGWANYVYQIFVPFSVHDAHLSGQMDVERYPMPNMFPHLGRKCTYANIDFSSDQPKKSDVHTMTFKGVVVSKSPPKPPGEDSKAGI